MDHNPHGGRMGQARIVPGLPRRALWLGLVAVLLAVATWASFAPPASAATTPLASCGDSSQLPGAEVYPVPAGALVPATINVGAADLDEVDVVALPGIGDVCARTWQPLSIGMVGYTAGAGWSTELGGEVIPEGSYIVVYPSCYCVSGQPTGYDPAADFVSPPPSTTSTTSTTEPPPTTTTTAPEAIAYTGPTAAAFEEAQAQMLLGLGLLVFVSAAALARSWRS